MLYEASLSTLSLEDAQLQRRKTVLVDDLTDLVITLALHDFLVDDAALTWVATSHLCDLILHVAEVGGEEAWADSEDLDAVVLELVVPVHHEHVESGLGAAVGDGLKANLLGPASVEFGCRKVGTLIHDSHHGEASNEE